MKSLYIIYTEHLLTAGHGTYKISTGYKKLARIIEKDPSIGHPDLCHSAVVEALYYYC